MLTPNSTIQRFVQWVEEKEAGQKPSSTTPHPFHKLRYVYQDKRTKQVAVWDGLYSIVVFGSRDSAYLLKRQTPPDTGEVHQIMEDIISDRLISIDPTPSFK